VILPAALLSHFQVQGKNIDHDTIYVPWGKADIFFPTDFQALGKVYRAAAEYVWGKGGKIETCHYHQVGMFSLSSSQPCAPLRSCWIS
jgi:hypothetical protein